MKEAALVGRVLGEFVIREQLSSGGFGMVFRAEQPALAREAVIKVLHTRLLASETVVQRFLLEARLASRLDHPYAAHIYAFGAEPDGVLWIAMELVRGMPLDRLLASQGAISLERFVPLLERICEVVHTAHEQGIVHRDLKPGNVMVLARAGQLLPKLLDLGIAKLEGAPIEAPPIARPSPSGPAIAMPMGSLDETVTPEIASSPPNDRPDAARAVSYSDTEPGIADNTLPGGEGSSAPVARPSTPSPPSTPSTTARSAPGSLSTPTAALRLTQVGSAMGSPLYMAPEQWADAGKVDARTDQYALAILCFEALTNDPPFTGSNQVEIAFKHARQPPPPLGNDLPPALDVVLARALAKNPTERYPSVLEFCAAFRTASGIASESATLPRLDDAVRTAATGQMPRPIALAIDALDTARNAHQARDALWKAVRVAARWVGIAALASHSHVQSGSRSTDPAAGDALRRLRDRNLTDAGWLELARELVRPFAGLREAHPLPELVDLLVGDGEAALDVLIALRASAEETSGSEEQVRELLDRAMPVLAGALAELAFFRHYRLLVPTEDGADDWTSSRREPRLTRIARGRDLPLGRPVLVDAFGAPVVTLWPFAQIHSPVPGSPSALFLLEGKGRRGARLVALPDSFEHEDEELWESIGGMMGESGEVANRTAPEELSPFPGLAAFTEANAGGFFGREAETDVFVNRLRVTPLLAVVGPSGAGKSSFVRAGVLPALGETWQAIVVRPGPAPLVSLLAALASAGVDTAGIETELADHPGALGSCLRAFAASRKLTVVVVVDQLEELFTLCDDDRARNLYADALVHAARSADDPVRVVMTLRDDFLLRAEALPPLRARLGPALQLLTTPAPPELRRILVEPIRRAGYEFDDPALPTEMVDAVASAPGALALLSFTADRLWELRDRRFRLIGHRAYRSLGGVGGALAQHAETTLQAMRGEEQRLVREVFRHAVTAEGTRAVLRRAELDQVLGGGPHAEAVIEKLVAARLLVISEGDASTGERVEIAHEALLAAWPRLVTWRREDAEGARLRDQLRAAARQWQERARPTGLLWRGDALAEYRRWRPRYPGVLTADEEAFAGASQADEARGRRLRRVLAVTAFAALAAVAVVLWIQNSVVERERSVALESQQAAQASASKMHDLLLAQYETQGRRLLLDDDPLQALAYLYKASELGASGVAHQFLVASAVQATGGELFTVTHDGSLNRVAFSADGAILATTGYDNKAKLWDAQTGKLLASLPHDAAVLRVEWSADGRVATGAEDGSVSIWDPATGKRLQRLEHKAAVQALAFLPDGARLLVETADDGLTLWDTATGKPAIVLHPPDAPPEGAIGSPAAISPDGSQIAMGDRAGMIWLWDGAGKPLGSLAGHSQRVNSVRFSADGKRLVTAGYDNAAIVWDTREQRKLASLPHKDFLNSASPSPDGARVVTGSVDGIVTVWDVATSAVVLTLTAHQTSAKAVWSPDGSQIATASDDGTAILWDAATGRRLARRVGHRGPIKDIVFAPSGRTITTSSLDGSATVSRAEPTQRITFLRNGTLAWGEAYAPTGSHVVTIGRDNTARIWDAATGREVLSLSHPGVFVARFSPDGQRLATAGVDGALRLWDARTGEAVAEMPGHAGTINSVAWSHDGEHLLTAGSDGTVRLWDAIVGRAEWTVTPHGGRQVLGAAFLPDGSVLSTGDDGTARISDRSGREQRLFQDPTLRSAPALDRAGTRAATATHNRSARIWRVADNATLIELIGHMADVQQVEWSPDDQLIVTASNDRTARIWDAATGDLLAVLEHPDWVLGAMFSPDEKQIVTVGNGAAMMWELPRFDGSQEELGALVRCRAPYKVDGDAVTPGTRDLSACAQPRRAQPRAQLDAHRVHQ